MTNEERAQQWAALLTHYGRKWRYNVPLDATVHRHKAVVYLGSQRIERGRDGVWRVTS